MVYGAELRNTAIISSSTGYCNTMHQHWRFTFYDEICRLADGFERKTPASAYLPTSAGKCIGHSADDIDFKHRLYCEIHDDQECRASGKARLSCVGRAPPQSA